MKNEKSFFTTTILQRIILLCVLPLCMLLTMTGCKDLGKANPFDYITITYSGYNGNGSASFNFDCEALVVSILGKEPETYEEFGQWLTAYAKYEDGIQISYEPKTGLSNGEKVRLSVSATGTAEKKVKSGTREYTVSGLPEVQTVDVFQNIEVSFEGIVGGITNVHVNRLTEDAFLRACSFHVEPEFGIRNGDAVTITITNSDALVKEYLCMPQETVKTVTVSGLAEYLTDSDLLPEDQIREMIPQYLADSVKEDSSWFTYSEPRYYKTYFCVGKEDCFAEDVNRLEIFVSMDEYMKGEYHETAYIPLIFRNLILAPDGTIALDYSDGFSPVFYDDPDSIVEQLEKTYEVDEIYIEY